ncbi:MAG: hypothetical protein MI742_12890 [Desulfobacterales bacterium]|nr:hypothetical protein [Desulfobacterales bacterium]
MEPAKEREMRAAVARSGRGFYLVMALGVVLVLIPLLFTDWPAWIVWPAAFFMGPIFGALLYLPLRVSGDLIKGAWFSFFRRQ